jgi:hypothetical protein
MSDEFTEHDLDTPSEADLDACYGSRFLSVTDIGTRKIRTKIVKVRKEEMQGNDGKKRVRFVVFLEGIDKPLVLNATNKDHLVGKFGRVPAKWIGGSIGVFVDPDVPFAGKRVGGLRLKAFGPVQQAPKPAPKPVAKPAPAKAAEWPEQSDDPGFDPDLNDNPDFTQAAE